MSCPLTASRLPQGHLTAHRERLSEAGQSTPWLRGEETGRDREGTGGGSRPARHRVATSTRGHLSPGDAHAGVAQRIETVVLGGRLADVVCLVAEELPDQVLAALGNQEPNGGLF